MADRSSVANSVRCILISDFQLGGLRGLLANDKSAGPAVEPVLAPFGQVNEVLMDPSHDCWTSEPQPHAALIWTQPQGAIQTFAQLLRTGESVPLKDILGEVASYAASIKGLLGRVRNVFVPLWVLPPHQRGLGMIDLSADQGLSGTVLAMNAKLVQELQATPGVFVLDAQRWVAMAGKGAYSPQMWYMAKSPFSNAVLAEAVGDLKAALAGLAGASRKLIVLDLDDTLWGGIVGDAGWENLKLGGHDPIGEAFADFQKNLKALTKRGIVLAIASKNEESVALEAIRKHPEMVLRAEDFAGWRINWNDKATNIAALAEELNLGLQSVVFLDDNPVERDRVRQALPEVFVPEWPKDKMLYSQALLQLRCFDSPHITQEDANRAQIYAADRQRRDLSRGVDSVDDFLRSLEIRIHVSLLDRGNLSRAAQLFNKTNQMNLSTRRLTAEELWDWANTEGHSMWTLRVVDKFGDSGLVGLVSLAQTGPDKAEIVDLILSCRVFGRRAEEAMMHVAIAHARSLGLSSISATYMETAKNKPTLTFLERSGLERNNAGRFVWEKDAVYPAPVLVSLDYTAETV